MVVSIGGNKLPFIQHYATSLLYMLKVKAAAVLVHDNFKRKVWILYPVYLLIKECVEILNVRYFPVEVSVDILTVSFLTDYEDALYVRFVLSAIHLTPLYICIYIYICIGLRCKAATREKKSCASRSFSPVRY